MTDLEFTALYIAQRKQAVRIAARILFRSHVPNPSIEAEDVTQSVFCSLLQASRKGVEFGAGYLMRSIHNEAVSRIKRRSAPWKIISLSCLPDMASRDMNGVVPRDRIGIYFPLLKPARKRNKVRRFYPRSKRSAQLGN